MKIIATSASMRPDAEPNRLESEPRARSLALDDEAARSYSKGGSSFLANTGKIESIGDQRYRIGR